ncbi:MAG: DnaJ domain-containing protein [Motiliproteus sp.]
MSILIFALTLWVLVVGVRWFLQRAPQRGKRFLLQLLLVTLALLGLWLALTGRLHWLVALFSTLLPFARRLLPLILPLLRWLSNQQKQQQPHRPGQQTAGQQSQITTRWLVMSLDHDSGDISGNIIDGPFAGRHLEALTDSELAQLYQQAIRQDPEGLKLLDAYIERHRPDIQACGSEQTDSPHTAPDSADISMDEAYGILGLEPGASKEAIIQAHKRMMQKVHPDRGGSNYLAVKINQAKQRLLG